MTCSAGTQIWIKTHNLKKKDYNQRTLWSSSDAIQSCEDYYNVDYCDYYRLFVDIGLVWIQSLTD